MIAGEVQAKVDEDVDLIAPYEAGDMGIGLADDGRPVIGELLEAIGVEIGLGHVGVAKGFELLAVVVVEQRDEVEAHDVPAELVGNVADAQAAVGIAGIRMRPDFGAKRNGVDLVVMAVLFEDGLRLEVAWNCSV